MGASATVSVMRIGSATASVTIDTWFINPRAGFLWTTREGLAFAIESGLQFPLSPETTSSLPLSTMPFVQSAVEAVGKSVIPTLDLLRVGFLL
jgi:hypothetical protein